MIRALLFDNDGILVDTERLYFESTRDALAEVGVELAVDDFVALSLRAGRSCFDLAREAGVAEAEIARVRARRDERYAERLREGVTVLDGVRETLAHLHGRLPMAIVTSCPRDFFHIIHGPLDLLPYFEFALTPDLYVRHKPHPEPYLEAARRLRLAPEQCLVVEDTERGMQAALAAGMTCLVVPHELSDGGDFTPAHGVLGSVREVPERLRGLLDA